MSTSRLIDVSARRARAGRCHAPVGERTPPRRLTGGWRIVARKEFADHVHSVRFVILSCSRPRRARLGPLGQRADPRRRRHGASDPVDLPLPVHVVARPGAGVLRVHRHPRAAARDRLRLRRDQRRTVTAHAAAARGAADPSRRDHQRQVRRRHRRHRPGLGVPDTWSSRLRGAAARRRSDVVRCRPPGRLLRRRRRLHLALAGVVDPAVGDVPAGGDGGARRARRVAGADAVRRLDRRHRGRLVAPRRQPVDPRGGARQRPHAS